MQNSLSMPFRPSETEAAPVFSVVIAYEDFETGKQARRTYDLLVEQLGREFRFANQMWKFDVLSVAKLREAAVKDAAAADIIIISARAQSDLPPGVKDWLETAITRGVNAIGLVGLFADVSESSPGRKYLAALADAADLEFFCQPGKWPLRASPLSELSHREGNLKSGSRLATFAGLDQNISHWGINE
jgi:hypothetical protein